MAVLESEFDFTGSRTSKKVAKKKDKADKSGRTWKSKNKMKNKGECSDTYASLTLHQIAHILSVHLKSMMM